jgi:hypothetical protein
MAWRWQYESEGGRPLTAHAANPSFPSQSDAETWLGESWRELRDTGVAAVRLLEDDREVYGPMSLLDG